MDDNAVEKAVEMAVEIVLRPITEWDYGFIYSSWRKSSFYFSQKQHHLTDPHSFFTEKTMQIKECLRTQQGAIACFSDDAETIVGYSIYSPTHLYWIYVKAEFRHRGIGTLLVPKAITTYTDDMTKIGAAIVKKKKLVTQGDDIK